jgi:hypothetical protein
MSGGPVLRLHRNGNRILNNVVPSGFFSATAVISRESTTSPLQVTHSELGETWASPLLLMYLLKFPYQDVSFAEAVQKGWIKSEGSVAKRLRIEVNAEGTRWLSILDPE